MRKAHGFLGKDGAGGLGEAGLSIGLAAGLVVVAFLTVIRRVRRDRSIESGLAPYSTVTLLARFLG
jgi:hypothetical protein